MKSFQVEQAIFASSDRGSMKGYQLVAKSPGIDRACAQELCRWAPTQLQADDDAHWTINYFPLSDQAVAVTRTTLGGPEYSSRGGIDVVTMILVLENEQFACYGSNPIALAKTAMAMGWLRLPTDMSRQHLEPIELPGRPVIERTDDSQEDELLDELTGLVEQAGRVAVIGSSDPVAVVGSLIPRLSIAARREFSFTTGLSPAVRRPFRAHFLPAADQAMQRTLDSQNISRVHVKRD